MQLQELAATTLPQGCNTNSKAANRQAQRVLEVGVRRGGFIKSGATRCFQLSSPHATCKLFAK